MRVFWQGPVLFVLLLALSLVVSGCPLRWQRVTLNQQIRGADVSFIVPGQTTFAEVLQHLGAPDLLKASEAGPIAQYDFLDVKDFKVDLLWPLPFFMPALFAVPSQARNLDLKGSGIGSDHFRVFFDSNWVAQYYSFEIHSEATEFVLWPFGE